MNKPTVAIPSITYAVRGKELLEKNGISAYIMRNTNLSKGYGCGYSLYIPKEVSRAIDILSDSGIKFMQLNSAKGVGT